jgi:8-amino-7-oxononanoate synthase
VADRAGERLAQRFVDELAALDAEGLRRRLAPAAGIDFTSNDYLGFAAAKDFRAEVARRIAAAAEGGVELFSPSARLLRGQTELHARTEARLARFKGAERALLFPSGWQANAGLIQGILRAGDLVVSDELNHASLIDGMRSTRAERAVVPHLDLRAIARELDRPRGAGEAFLVVESLYSMEGDLAPLGELAALCARYDSHLIVDEAHATGLYGARGSGWIEACGVEQSVVAAVTTFGKALALQGAAVTGSQRLVELVVQRCRAFLFSTALSPLLLVALEVALDVVESQPQRRARLHANARRLRSRLNDGGLPIEPDGSPIVPVLIGDNARALAAAKELQRRGFDVRAIRPPTVPEGTARLRVSVHADRSDAELDALAAALVEVAG